MRSLSNDTTVSRVFVVGSLNVDLQMSVVTLPKPGETIVGGDLHVAPGGKGANQAVAAAQLGVVVTIAGRVGDDHYGRFLIAALADQGVAARLVQVDSSRPTGVALIVVAADGENMITESSGANACVDESDVASALADLKRGDVLVLQLEIPVDAVRAAAQHAFARGGRVILNAAPARDLPHDLLESVHLLIVNEGEANALYGSVERALATDLPTIVTLGKRGAVLSDSSIVRWVPAPQVEPVDTTGAGDALVGAIAAELARGSSIPDAARAGVAAGAAATLHFGAQAALPSRDRLLALPSEPGPATR